MKKWLFLLRAFFPSWRFFDVAGPEIRLEVRFGRDSTAMGDWVNCIEQIPRSLRNLVFNPHGGFSHAYHNLLNHLNHDIQEAETPESIAARSTYRIARNLARSRVLESTPFVYQFRLILSSDQTEILVSPVHAG